MTESAPGGSPKGEEDSLLLSQRTPLARGLVDCFDSAAHTCLSIKLVQKLPGNPGQVEKCRKLYFDFWLPPRDSNPDMLLQRQLSYH